MPASEFHASALEFQSRVRPESLSLVVEIQYLLDQMRSFRRQSIG